MSTEPSDHALRYAIITPSFTPDLERCRVLADSVRRHVEDADHYIIIDRRDEPAFRSLRGRRTHLVMKQDILPWWLHQVPLSSKWWASLKGLPVRGWIVQQIVKLSVDAVTTAEVCIFVDSDAFLIRQFAPQSAERDARVPLFREVLPVELSHNTRWLASAARLVGAVPAPEVRTSYVTQAVTWRRSNVVQLHQRIEETTGRGWVEALAGLASLSEYTLYGVFCDRVLGETSGHYPHDGINMLNYWDSARLDEGRLRLLRSMVRPEHVGVMISAKSDTHVAAIRRVFELGA